MGTKILKKTKFYFDPTPASIANISIASTCHTHTQENEARDLVARQKNSMVFLTSPIHTTSMINVVFTWLAPGCSSLSDNHG